MNVVKSVCFMIFYFVTIPKIERPAVNIIRKRG